MRKSSPNFTLHWSVHYPLAVGAVGAAFLARRELSTLTGGELPTYITFYPVIMVVALFWGGGAGVTATVAAAVVAMYGILPPRGSFHMASLSDSVGLALFCFMGVFMSVISELYRRARYQRQEQEANARLAAVVESSDDAILSKDLSGIITSWNAGAERLFGYKADEIIGQPVTKLLTSDRQPEETTIMTRLHAGERLEHFETVRVRKDGRPLEVSLTTSPLRNAAGELVGTSTIIRDITQHKRGERRAELLAQTARELLETDSPHGVVNALCERVLDFLDCQFFFNFLVDEHRHRLRLNACAGISAAQARDVEWLNYGTAVCGCAARDACRIVVEDVQHSTDPRTQLVKSYGIQACAAHPLMVQGRVRGTLSFGTSTRTRFTDDELSLMKVVVDQVAIAIDRQQTQAALKHSNEALEHRVAARTADLHFTNSLLALFSQKTTVADYLDSVVQVIQQWTDCQALGIRLKTSGLEIPYESCAGFEPGLLQLEDCLSLRTEQCLCIRAASGEVAEPDRPLLTPGGSFRSDNAIAFVTSLPEEHLPRYRGNCMKFGFASVAVIPIRHRGEILGVLHLADRRPGHFPLPSIEFIESMTPLIGEAIHRFQTEAELAEHRDHLEILVKQRTAQLEKANTQLQLEVSERKQAQENLVQTAEELQRSNRDLEQFAYVASHDLQEPLRAVGGYVSLLEKRFADKLDPKAREYISGTVEGAQRMERLITDLLAFSRVGTRGCPLSHTDLNAALRNGLHNLQASIRTSNASVTSDTLPVVAADATQMVQLFQNLIGNALKFHGEAPPEIHIGAVKQDARWVFAVRDNGIGIAPHYFERIFQIFQRLHTRKHYPGTGIGLAICKKIVERHGGDIWVESKPGQGSTFFFSIPECPLTEQAPT